ncbi:MAG: thioredoxin [Planctomycetes bacterium]|nr:thioredoxin [Planctomycetota bacterium]
MSNVRDLNENLFDDAITDAPHPVLVDFSATWCGPCKQLAPTIEAVARDYDGRLDVYKVDIDESPELAARYGVRGIPTCVFFHSGKEVDRFTGGRDLRAVKEQVDRVLASARA